MSIPQISVVVATSNSRDDLQRALLSLHNQVGTDFECLVVGCGPQSDGAGEVFASTVGGDIRFRYQHAGSPGKYPALNAGFRATSADVVFVMDDSVDLVDRDTLASTVQRLADHPEIGVLGFAEAEAAEPSIDGATGASREPAIPPSSHPGFAGFGEITRWGAKGGRATGLTVESGASLENFGPGAMAIRRDVFEAVGGFFTAYSETGIGFRSDADFCLQVRRRGVSVAYSVDGPRLLRNRSVSEVGRNYLVTAGRNDTFFLLSNFWSKRSAPLFLTWDLLVGNGSLPGVLRLLSMGVINPLVHWRTLRGKWLGMRLFWKHGPAAAR